MKNIRKIIYLIVSFCLFCIPGCSDREPANGDDGVSHIHLSVRPLAGTINQDNRLWEDRVDELRMIAFKSDDGSVSFNQKLYFPDGFLSPSRSVQIPTGVYDFYFIANESVYPADFTAALLDIENKSEFTSDTRFTAIPYDPDFKPDETSSQGRFLMSAVYENIPIATGGTETNPLPLPVPGGKVELVRALAKVEVIFRKSVSGSSIPENTITSVDIRNVAADYSVPPKDEYYSGPVTMTDPGILAALDYAEDSIGSVTFYVPEFLLAEGSVSFPELHINNKIYPIQTDDGRQGLVEQRRTTPPLSDNSIIRNYHYIVNTYINAEGGVQVSIYVQPWTIEQYLYIFQGDQSLVVPPVEPTDSSIIIPTECGKVEIMSHNENFSGGLREALNYQVSYYDPETQGPLITQNPPPYYCERTYGPGWRLINSCELLSFLAALDKAYTIWLSNTWLGADHGVPYYPLHFREEAQFLLEKLTGQDLSGTILYPENNNEDYMVDNKLDIIDRFFTPGDILLKEEDFPNGWPFEAPPGTSLPWYYNEVTIQVQAFWYGSGYISPAIRENWDRILYGQFEGFEFSSTVSRCVRPVN